MGSLLFKLDRCTRDRLKFLHWIIRAGQHLSRFFRRFCRRPALLLVLPGRESPKRGASLQDAKVDGTFVLAAFSVTLGESVCNREHRSCDGLFRVAGFLGTSLIGMVVLTAWSLENLVSRICSKRNFSSSEKEMSMRFFVRSLFKRVFSDTVHPHLLRLRS